MRAFCVCEWAETALGMYTVSDSADLAHIPYKFSRHEKMTYTQTQTQNRVRPESLNRIGGIVLNFHTDNQKGRGSKTKMESAPHMRKK